MTTEYLRFDQLSHIAVGFLAWPSCGGTTAYELGRPVNTKHLCLSLFLHGALAKTAAAVEVPESQRGEDVLTGKNMAAFISRPNTIEDKHAIREVLRQTPGASFGQTRVQ